MRRLQIDHLTTYRFSETVTLLPHTLLLRPREDADVHIEAARISIFPSHRLHWHSDQHGNAVAVAYFSVASDRLSIASHVLLQHHNGQPLNFLVAESAVRYPFRYSNHEQAVLQPYLLASFGQDQPDVGAWLRSFWQPGQVTETFVLLDTLNKVIARDFAYLQRPQAGVQAPAETLAKHSGSCRDTATLFIEACRYLGMAARFVSGYLHSPFARQDPGSTHAWSEVYLPGAGWKGFDSTSGLLAGDRHVAVAVGTHPESIPPVSGAFVAPRPQSPLMEVSVSVAEII